MKSNPLTWKLLVDTLLAVEDRRFMKHRGIDIFSILRALAVNLKQRRFAQGGSTITQQLARTVYLYPEKTIIRKLLEVFHAIKIEMKYSKETILSLYVSLVYMGHTNSGDKITGLVEAARYYYNKSIDELNTLEIATLVGMLKGPNIYKPGTDKGKTRTMYVLVTMHEEKIINREALLSSTKVLLS